MRREVSQLMRRLEREFGCTVQMSGSGHYRVTRPGYRMITVSESPNGGNRALGNIRADMKRHLRITL
jgi:hypothetical protein